MVVIDVSHLKKEFNLQNDKAATLKDKLLRLKSRNASNKVIILDDINLKIYKGQVVGLIGRNGSGKSTLLKLLSKILYPTSGDIMITGRVSSLLELGAGFHPDFSGIENIYMNASLFGLSRKEIDGKLKEIIDFSELHDDIHKPVRIYSSGMYMRLAFSIATIVDPDVLFIDEVLAVGDAAFQQKCLNRIMELKRRGKTIVIVSHDQGVIEKLCDYCFWLKKGKLIAEGHTKEVLMQYIDDMHKEENDRMLIEEQQDASVLQAETEQTTPISAEATNRWGNNKVVIKNLDLKNSDLKSSRSFKPEESLVLDVEFEIRDSNIIRDLSFGVAVYKADGTYCYGTNSFIDGVKIPEQEQFSRLKLSFDPIALLPGEYWLDIAAHSISGEPYDYIRQYKYFSIYSIRQEEGIVRLNHEWMF